MIIRRRARSGTPYPKFVFISVHSWSKTKNPTAGWQWGSINQLTESEPDRRAAQQQRAQQQVQIQITIHGNNLAIAAGDVKCFLTGVLPLAAIPAPNTRLRAAGPTRCFGCGRSSSTGAAPRTNLPGMTALVFQTVRNCLLVLVLILSFAVGASANGQTPILASVDKESDGIMMVTAHGRLRLQVWSDRIIRVTYVPGKFPWPTLRSFSVVSKPAKTKWALAETNETLMLKTDSLQVRVDGWTGAVGFYDLKGNLLLREAARDRSLATDGSVVGQSFVLAPDERIYGLGQHQGGLWNYHGSVVHLQQKNMEVAVPVLVSSKGYGVLWDNPAITDVDVGKTDAGMLSWTSEAREPVAAVDYYFLFGPTADGVIQDYRRLTGAAPMMGRWVWGFWQCKERYASQSELTNVVAEYRKRGVPLDGIIQDWQYWPTNGWGSHAFDPSRYPDPPQMIRDLHGMNAHVLISVWPKFDRGTANFDELERAGVLYPEVLRSVYPPGWQKWYDPFNPKGRRIYWNEIDRELFKLGVDGWWLDASEPELSGKWGEFRAFPTAAGPGAEVFNAYPLMHTTGIYQGQRAATDQKRVCILTRSAWAGQQRNAAITWSGDIHGRWAVLAKQIPAGLNFSLSGIPYWNTDIGGFFDAKLNDPKYQELFTRWFQFGAFCPMFRVHGTSAPKELWRWDEPTQKIWETYVDLRYRLLPYLYSVSWQVTSDGGTMMRPLMMDFADDSTALDIGDQYLFGPALMVCPVTQPGATNRSVYLPGQNGWYDFWTGKREAGGRQVAAAAPIETMPLFVRAGSILPLGPVVQYAAEKPAAPLEIRVYRGADGAFTLYEDEGDNYNYEKGKYSTIPLTWNDATGTLTIGLRHGKFPGMVKERTFRIVFVDEGHGNGVAETGSADQLVTYAGQTVTMKAEK
jgi:alpha-D-xyloside xylohydrolase